MSKINFEIGTSYRNEGMQQFDNALKANKNTIDAARRGMGDLTTAIKGVSPEAAVAMNGVQKFLGAFAQGGLVGGVITLAIQGLAKGIEVVTNNVKEAREKAKAFADTIRDGVVAAANRANESYKSIVETLKEANAQALALQKNANVEIDQQTSMNMLQIQEELIRDLKTAYNKEDEERKKAFAEVRMAEERRSQAIEKNIEAIKVATEKEKSAYEAAEEAGNAVVAARQACADAYAETADYAAAVGKAEDKYSQAMEDAAGDRQKERQAEIEFAAEKKRIQEQFKQDIEARKNAGAAVIEAEKAEKKAKEELAQATKDKTAAMRQREIDTKKADLEILKAKERHAETVKAFNKSLEKEYEDQKQQDYELQQAKADQIAAAKKAKDQQLETAKKSESLNAEIDRLNSEASKVHYDPIAQNEGGGAGGGEGGGGGGNRNGKDVNVLEIKKKAEQKLKQQLQNVVVNPLADVNKKPRKLDEETWQKIKDGTASVAEIERFKRFQKMEERYITSSKANGDLTKFFQIAGKDQRIWSKSDKEFMTTYAEAFPQIKGNLTQEKIAEAQKKLLNSDTFNAKFATVERMEAWMKNLGVK